MGKVRHVDWREFEMYKTNYQKNEKNSTSFNFIPKVNVQFPNLRFGAIRSRTSQKRQNSCS